MNAGGYPDAPAPIFCAKEFFRYEQRRGIQIHGLRTALRQLQIGLDNFLRRAGIVGRIGSIAQWREAGTADRL